MISIFTAFTTGIKDVYKTKKLVLIFYLVQFVLAYILTKPISQLLSKAFSTATLNDVILNRFDLKYLYAMLREFGKGVDLFGLVFPLSLLYILISIFLTAGVYWLFYTKTEFKLSEYFIKCGIYFSRFLKLFLVSMIFYVACFAIFALLSSLFGNLTKDTVTEVWPVILTFVKYGLLIFLFALVLMIFDYAKILLIDESTSGVFSAAIEAMKFFMMNFFKTIGIFLLYIITGVLFFAVFKLIDSSIITNTYFTISIFFILTQIYIYLRQYLRLALYDSLIVYYQETITAIPGMLNKEMLEKAVENYERRAQESKDNSE